ncbi:MAG: glycosyltransferase family 4 protein [Candidatus Marinimicrobia bacterium]|nr:glycosyltransferase family 4 protein [Candidatus Neomarinimicrobiota bacterium]
MNKTVPQLKNILFIRSLRKHKWGGVEKWMFEVGKDLKKKGYNVIYCARPGSRFISAAEYLSFKYYEVRFSSDIHPLVSLKLRKIILREKIDLICTGGEKELRLLAPLFWFGRKPVIIIRKGSPLIKNKWRFKIVYDKLVDAVITPSHALADYLLELLPWLETEKVRVVHNGVEIPGGVEKGRFRKELNIDENKFLAVILGRFNIPKGHKYLFEALAMIKDEITDILVAVVGGGDQEKKFRDEAERLGIADIVNFVGHRSDVNNILSDADLLIHPSLREGMPNTVLEALAIGTAVLATNIPAINEIMDGKEVMALVPPADSKAIAEKLIQLKSDSVYRNKLAVAGKEHVTKNFSLRNMLDGSEKIFVDTFNRKVSTHY